MIVQTKLKNYALWVYLEEFDCCVCIPHKNGSCSFRREIIKIKEWNISDHTQSVMLRFFKDGHGPFHPKEVELQYADKDHFLSVRHPLERFVSLWRNKCRDKMGIPRDVWGLTPDELMDFIEDHEDHHWRKQADYVTKTTIPIDDRDLLKKLGVGVVLNATQGDDDPAMPVDRIVDYYADDVLLWEEANECLRTNIAV